MKRSINFGSIFRKPGPQPTAASEPTDQSLSQKLAGRSITLKPGDLAPQSAECPEIAWDLVDGQITVPATAIEGILEGRARIKAQHLKALSPSPIGAEIHDATQYLVLLASLIPQIQDLLVTGQSETSREPEFETPFTVLARQDGARFGEPEPPQNEEPTDGPGKEETRPPDNDVATQDLDGPEPDPDQDDRPLPPIISLRTLQQLTTSRDEEPDLPDQPWDEHNHTTPMKKNETFPVEPRKLAKGPIQSDQGDALGQEFPAGDHDGEAQPAAPRQAPASSPAGQGVELLQEIFMTSEPLDARKVASFVQQFPGVTGALILLEGGAALGGQLPDSLNTEAALQAPQALQLFLSFLTRLEPAEKPTRFLTVSATNSISLVSSGRIVLLVSHQGRKLPPGLAQRLTQTAQALALVYSN